ncbi:MAG: PKD domain-containing protein [Bacteroidales bacterium]|nr:PKD domain-containing protein [Bacteroidales bacterium]
MKNLIILSAIIMLLAGSCEMKPRAGFHIDSPVVDVYENIYFTNTSSHADSYRWDFGDGTLSSTPNPTHYYELPGRYLVTLEAYKGSQEFDQTSMYIDVTSTSLEIEVLEFYKNYPIPEASIVLYTTQYDWDYQSNQVYDQEWLTDANGIVLIHGLRPIIYYVDIWHPSHNNYWLAEDDMGWVKTDPLEKDVINAYTFYVDYVQSISRKDGRKVEQYKVIKIERKAPGNNAR